MSVRLSYRAFDEDGEAVEEHANGIDYVHGFGALLPRIESSLEGLGAGAQKEVLVAAKDAFGPRRKDAIVEFDRADFPPGVEAGDHFDAENADGNVVVLRVLEVFPESILVDTNHPLAGQNVRFELEILEVRPATASELERAERHLTQPESAAGPLIPAASLLRGHSQRYEKASAVPVHEDGTEDEN